MTKYATVNDGTASEAKLQAALANNGPVVAAIEVTDSMQNYKSGKALVVDFFKISLLLLIYSFVKIIRDQSA
jgi:hypothetical protein